MPGAKTRRAKESTEPGGAKGDSGPDDEYGRGEDEGAAEAAARQAEVAPVHGEPGFDPATTPWDISALAGYGDGGFDTAQGVDDYVMGRRHAPGELEVESSTEGGPLDLDPHESFFRDDTGHGDMGIGLGSSEGVADMDWRAEERSHGAMFEPEEAGLFDDGAAMVVGGDL